MEKRQEIEQELRDLGITLGGIGAVNPYLAPAGYFNALPGEILAKVREEAILPSAAAPTYEVPAGYFEGLAASVLQKIHTGTENTRSELDTVAPMLNTISKENVYTVPAGYFTNIDFARKAIKPEAKVITLRIARKWMQYASAAVMAGILVTSAFLFTNEKPHAIDNDIVTSAFNNMDAAELVKYLDNPEHFVAAPAATSLASEEELKDVKTTIQHLSDEELNQYLKDNAEGFETTPSEKE